MDPEFYARAKRGLSDNVENFHRVADLAKVSTIDRLCWILDGVHAFYWQRHLGALLESPRMLNPLSSYLRMVSAAIN